jgi:hypothetical protein
MSVSEWIAPSPDPLAHARGYIRRPSAFASVAMSVSEWIAPSPDPLAHARGYIRRPSAFASVAMSVSEWIAPGRIRSLTLAATFTDPPPTPP